MIPGRATKVPAGSKRCGVLSAVLLAVLFAGAPAAAQRYGQWWWDGSLEYSGEDYDTQVEGFTHSFSRSELRLFLGLNGYLLDPTLGQFRLQLGSTLSNFGNGKSGNTDQLTYSGSLRLFPRGAYVVDLFARQLDYDYSELFQETLFVRTVPDSAFSWGGKLRIRRGPLRGVRLGFEQNTTDYLGFDASESHNREFVEWSRSKKGIGARARLEHDRREFSRFDYMTDDLHLDVHQGWFAASWRGDVQIDAINRQLEFSAAPQFETNILNVRSSANRPTARGDLVSLSYQMGYLQSGGDRLTNRVTGRYAFQHWEDWQVTPTVSYQVLDYPEQTITAPQAGIAASWNRQVGRFELGLSQGVDYQLQQYDSVDGELDGSSSAWSLSSSFSVIHGSESSLRKELEVILATNRLREAFDSIADLPDLGIGLNENLSEDVAEARMVLSRRWKSLKGRFETRWTHRQSSRDSELEGVVGDTLFSSLRLDRRRLVFSFNYSRSSIEIPDRGDQTVDSLVGSVSFKPWRRLTLRASHRISHREVLLGPDVDGEFSEVSVVLDFGTFVARGLLTHTLDDFLGNGERESTGFRWMISRHFSGWLPFATGVRARGSIR